MIRRPPRSTPLYSSAASDVYKRQVEECPGRRAPARKGRPTPLSRRHGREPVSYTHLRAHRLRRISYAVFCLKKKKRAKFGFLVEAMKNGKPPHNGMDLGLE